MKFTDFKIGVRLGAAFTFLLIMLIAITAMGISRMDTMYASLRLITEVNNTETTLIEEMRATVGERMIALRNIVLLKEQNQIQAEIMRAQTQAKLYDDTSTTLEHHFSTQGMNTAERTLMTNISEQSRLAKVIVDKVLRLESSHQSAATTDALMNEMQPIHKRWMDALTALAAEKKQQNTATALLMGQTYTKARASMIILSNTALLFGIVLACLITRSITRPLKRAIEVARTVADGNLTSIIETDAKDETGTLLQALASMNVKLQSIVRQVRTVTNTVAEASQEIASGNIDLSSRTERQAASLEETAASMEELTGTVRGNEDNTVQAQVLAAVASETAQRAGHMVTQVVKTMATIDTASRKIVEITSVIDSIAFQTNILALNAAVEAARAGDQGRGFAVVASEVRMLAQRSATAAKEIKMLIGDSASKVEEGTALVDAAGATMEDVVASVQRVRVIIGDITAAGREQAAGIEQINTAIVHMDMITQENAALVEESAAAATALQEQATRLRDAVSAFVLYDGAVQPSPSPKPCVRNSVGTLASLT